MPSLTMRCASRSEMGPRANNEDAVFTSPRLVAVADGVGGAVAGEVASTSAIDELRALEKRRLSATLEEELGDAVARANDRLGFLALCHPELAGMGTTLTAVALSNDGEYLVANMGDSRTYLYRDRALRQLTRDGSYVQELIDQGALTTEQARVHPQRSLVLDALDGTDRTIGELARHHARLGDRLLLCSDGVSDYVADGAIADALALSDPDEAAAALVTLALDAGGRDNVSAVVADVVERRDPRAGWLDALPAPAC